MSQHEKNILQLAKIIKDKTPTVTLEYEEESLTVAVNRKLYVKRIKDKFLDGLIRYVEEPDYLIIIRWFYTQKLIDFTGADPLIPYNTDDNEGLYYELEKINVPVNEIKKISDNLHDMIKRFDKNFMNKNSEIKMFLKDGSYLFVRDNLKFYLKHETYEKLKTLYNGEPSKLNERIFKLWCRYEALAAPGYHAAIPTSMFELIRRELKVNHELFASPFNCTLENYTSAYPDTDVYFGSKGNFFREYPKLLAKGGSFEANPPFLEEHMTALSLIIEESLDKYTAVPLSFVVIYPAWEDAISHSMLKNSKFNIVPQKVLTFEALNHHYVKSSQYWNNTEIIRQSQSRSSIFILQNDLGKKEYPVTNNFIEKLIKSFN